MNQSDFIRRVRQLESGGAAQDQRFQWRVLGWLLLGYGVIGGTALLAMLAPVALFLALLFSKHLIVALLFGGSLLAASHFGWRLLKTLLAVPVEHGEDALPLQRQQAPKLFELLDTLERAFQVRVHQVRLDARLNAAIRQQPRLGGLLGSRNTLIIGVPLLATFTLEQTTAVLAHEFAHLRGDHGRFGSHVYQMRLSWYRLRHHLERQRSYASYPLLRFLRWYAPRFNAESFVLNRASEYAADQASARLTSAEDAATALLVSHLADLWLDRVFWPHVYRHSREHAEPDVAPYHLLLGLTPPADSLPLAEMVMPWSQVFRDPKEWINQTILMHEQLSRLTDYDDTHPCLYDRISALGMEADLPPLPLPCDYPASQVLLGESLPVLAQHLNGLWREHQRGYWHEQHQLHEPPELATYHGLLRKQATQAFSAEDWLQLAIAQMALGKPDEECRLSLRAALTAEPQHARSLYQLGLLAIRMENWAEAPDILQQAMQADPQLEAACLDALARMAMLQDDDLAAERYLLAHDEALRRYGRSRQELACVDASDNLQCPTLSAYQRKQLQEALQPVRSWVRQVWVAHKVSRLNPRHTTWLLLVEPQTSAAESLLSPVRSSHTEACRVWLDRHTVPMPDYYQDHVLTRHDALLLARLPECALPLFDPA
ncbi:M48 family metallopeptidase [Leeia aquatica]|uniref:M48 family metalloprotease n=1 Tax=Leeia aquatica TaxID=2725557 RepID=A0A847S1V3_9NEIS|nr:M48 family metallopeptidase [Leeia aquatica]NLR73704.1 M48 family metalloprotease [Leeia aquatica]